MADTRQNIYKPWVKLGLLLLGTIIGSGFVSAIPACAYAAPAANASASDDTASPFAIDNSYWVSLDHYKEKAARGAATPAAPETPSDANSRPEAAPTAPTAHEASGDAATHPLDSPPVASAADAAAPAPAAPVRAVNLPVMPGMNKGYKMDVYSTEDEQPRPEAQITNIDTKPDVALPANNWQNPNDIAKQGKEDDFIGIRSGDETVDLHVRMTYLPDASVKPIYHDRAPTRGHGDLSTAEIQAASKPKKPGTDKAACAALDEYKKQQLDAIKGDRATLQALQDVIAQMGLQKELSFMAGAHGSVDTASSQDVAAATTK